MSHLHRRLTARPGLTIPRPSRDGIPTAEGRMVQLMCDALRRASGASPCELCDEPCDDPQAIECARVALTLGARA